GSLETERPAQFLRFTAGETGSDHRHPKQLFLKKRHSQRAFEHGLQSRVRVYYGLAALPAFQIWMNHISDDRARAAERYLYNDVVKALGAHAGQTGHLRAASDLEHSNGIRFLQRGIDIAVAGRQVSKIDVLAIMIADEFQRIFKNRHHAKAEQIHFH